jgi:hypothetical protein
MDGQRKALKQTIEGQVLRMIRLQERLEQIEAALRAKAEAVVDAPELAWALAECREVFEDSDALAFRLARFAVELGKRGGSVRSD